MSPGARRARFGLSPVPATTSTIARPADACTTIDDPQAANDGNCDVSGIGGTLSGNALALAAAEARAAFADAGVEAFRHGPDEVQGTGALEQVLPDRDVVAPLAQGDAQRVQGMLDFEAALIRAQAPNVLTQMLLRGANVVWYGDLAADPIRKKGGKK